MKNIIREKYKSVLLAIALAALTVSSVVSAAEIYELGLKGHINTGSVAIDLKPLCLDSDGKLKDAEEKAVSPGEHLSFMPVVENKRADAYVRLKVDIIMDEETETPVTNDDIYRERIRVITDDDVFKTIDSSEWIRKGDYFYDTKVLKQGGKSCAFQGIIIPDNWVSDPDKSLPSAPDGKTPAQASGFRISLHADAIQAENFKPDFESDNPWGSVIIEDAKTDDNRDYSVASPVIDSNKLIFTGSGSLEANTDDLFRNFNTYMPVGLYTDSILISNKAANDITVFFRTDNVPTGLKDKMKLSISCSGKTIYNGSLSSTEISDYKELVKLRSGKEAELKYTVKLPEDSLNEYSVLSEDIEWLFKVAEHTDKDNENNSVNKAERKNSGPETGDAAMLLAWMTAFVLSASATSFLIHRNRRS